MGIGGGDILADKDFERAREQFGDMLGWKKCLYVMPSAWMARVCTEYGTDDTDTDFGVGDVEVCDRYYDPSRPVNSYLFRGITPESIKPKYIESAATIRFAPVKETWGLPD